MRYHILYNAQTGETFKLPFSSEEEIAWDELNKPKEKDFADAIQNLIDTTAQSKSYENGISLASYDSSTNPTWASEAQTFIAWRDQVWMYAFGELEKVKNGTRQQPTIQELLDELPIINWP